MVNKSFAMCNVWWIVKTLSIDLLESASINSTDESNNPCPNSCIEISYEIMSKRIPHDLSNMALISMYYQSDHLRLLEEYLVFDFNSILVAMGGSLGLFLGFSFFHCVTGLCSNTMDFARRLFERRIHQKQGQTQAVLQC